MRRDALWMVSAAAAAAVDLASKFAATRWLDDPLDLGVVTLRVVLNPGVAFGLGTDLPSWLLLVVTSLVALLLVVSVGRGVIDTGAGTVLVLGGAVANIADRALDGSVVDVIDLGWWPTFNLADVFIVTGIGLILLRSLRESPDETATREPTREAAAP